MASVNGSNVVRMLPLVFPLLDAFKTVSAEEIQLFENIKRLIHGVDDARTGNEDGALVLGTEDSDESDTEPLPTAPNVHVCTRFNSDCTLIVLKCATLTRSEADTWSHTLVRTVKNPGHTHRDSDKTHLPRFVQFLSTSCTNFVRMRLPLLTDERLTEKHVRTSGHVATMRALVFRYLWLCGCVWLMRLNFVEFVWL
ncbi:hypothetical protein L596_004691 [Steinernema carpocapsae]|uniref:Uncharacterized protein n=1 Tax=Steinernema carpocapsae TaxID=34508 RepID=A0A4U8UXN6_STECR|nr:hypothetical protein L596_004691 [Steinernema carpocapsae]